MRINFCSLVGEDITKKRVIILGLIILLLSSLWIRASSIIRVPLVLDDDFWLHVGWMVYKGNIPYKDFFVGHTPLSYYIAALAFVISGETTDVIFAQRYIMFALYIGILLVTYLLAKKVLNSSALSLFSVVIFAYGSELLLIEQILLARDLPTILFEVSGIYMLIIGYKKSRLFLFLSGVFFSLAFFTHQKALFFIIAMFVSLLIMVVSRAREKRATLIIELKPEAKDALPILLGFTVVAIPIFAYFYLNGALYDFLYFAGPFIANRQQDFSFVESSYYHILGLVTNVIRSPIIWVVGTLMALLSLLSVMYKLKNRKAVDHIETILTMSVWVTILCIFLLIRFNSLHDFFPLSPILSIFAVRSFEKNYNVNLDNLKSKADNYPIIILMLFLVLGVALPAVKAFNFYDSNYYSPHYNYALERQINFTNYLNNITDPEDKIYDYGAAIFRKSSYFFWGNVRAGSDDEFIESMKKERVKVVTFLYGENTRDSSKVTADKVTKFVEDNFILDKLCTSYLPGGHTDFFVYVAGKNITANDFSGCGVENGFLVCSNSTAYAPAYLIADTSYEVSVVAINHKDGGKLQVYVDGDLVNSTDTRSKGMVPALGKVSLGRLALNQGVHNVTLAVQDGNVILRELVLKMETPDVNLCYPDIKLY